MHAARTPERAPPPLVGRDRELAALRDALDATLAGRGSLVLIGGEAGIGKTALAEALCAEAVGRGALVLVGRCYDLTEIPPYGPWRELFARLPRPDAAPLPAALLPPGAGGEPLDSQEAIIARARDDLAARAKRQPLVLLLEDLHWADPASIDALRVLARLVAAGLSDAQVADRLAISPRTVGQHLRSVYAKLGVPSRTAAAHLAGERGLL